MLQPHFLNYTVFLSTKVPLLSVLCLGALLIYPHSTFLLPS